MKIKFSDAYTGAIIIGMPEGKSTESAGYLYLRISDDFKNAVEKIKHIFHTAHDTLSGSDSKLVVESLKFKYSDEFKVTYLPYEEVNYEDADFAACPMNYINGIFSKGYCYCEPLQEDLYGNAILPEDVSYAQTIAEYLYFDGTEIMFTAIDDRCDEELETFAIHLTDLIK